MGPDLDNRIWPVPLNQQESHRGTPEAGKLSGAAGRSFVREGYVLAKELAIRGSGRAIPPGECAITSLAMGGDWVFGATSGSRAHIFAYCGLPATEVVLDTLTLQDHTSIRNALVNFGDSGLFAGTSAPGRTGYPGGEVLNIRVYPIGDVIQEWGSQPTVVESLGRPVAGEGIACMIGDRSTKRLYGLSDKTGTLFSVDVAGGRVETHSPIDELGRFSRQLILGPDGLVYGCGTAGQIVRFEPESGTLENIPIYLPTMAGRGQYAQVGAWAIDAVSGLIYAGDVADGLLSVIDVRKGQVRTLGKPTAQPHIRALAVAPDGRVYGAAGLRDTMCHLFCYTPGQTRSQSEHVAGSQDDLPQISELRDLGVMASGTERRWYGYEFDCAVAGADGRIYFGESDRISHLFIFFPPILPSVTPASREETGLIFRKLGGPAAGTPGADQ